jgi:hypothetical protein
MSVSINTGAANFKAVINDAVLDQLGPDEPELYYVPTFKDIAEQILKDKNDRFVPGKGWLLDGKKAPDYACMTLTLNTTKTPYHEAESFTYCEADGESLGTYVDPRLAFTVTCVRVTGITGCPIEVDFRRVNGGGISAAYVVFYYGDPSIPASTIASGGWVNNNVKFGAYSGTISGDFNSSFSTNEHYIYARWRWCSWNTPELWPFPVTPTATLISEHLIAQYDATLGLNHAGTPGGAGQPYTPYVPMGYPGGLCGLRTDMGPPSEDTSIGLISNQAAQYFATGNTTTGYNELMNMAEACNTYSFHWRDPATKTILNHIGVTRQYYTWYNTGAFSHNPSAGPAQRFIINFTNSGGTDIVLPTGFQVIDSNNNTWNVGAHTVAAGTSWIFTFALNSTSANYNPVDNSTSTRFSVNGVSTPFANLTATFLTGISSSAPYGGAYEAVDGLKPVATHMVNVPYAAAILTRDPFLIETVQAVANFWDGAYNLPSSTTNNAINQGTGTAYAQIDANPGGYFTNLTSITYNSGTGLATATLPNYIPAKSPAGVNIPSYVGSTATMVVANAVPAAYNGTYTVTFATTGTFTYTPSTVPAGNATTPGRWQVPARATGSYSAYNWPTEETRGQAWKVRDLSQAVLATPSSVPQWLMPQSDFADCLHQLYTAYMYRVNNPWNSVSANFPFFFCLQGQFPSTQLDATTYYWEDYMLWAMSRAIVANAEWVNFAAFIASARINMGVGTGGWCNSIVTAYGGNAQSVSGPPYAIVGGEILAVGSYPTTWGDAWNIQGPMFQNISGNNVPPSSVYPTCPGTLIISNGNWDYNGNHHAALCALKQLSSLNAVSGFVNYYNYFVPSYRTLVQNYNPTLSWKHCVAQA